MRFSASIVALLAISAGMIGTSLHAQIIPQPLEPWTERPVIRVWPGVAPGSEADSRTESKMLAPMNPAKTLHILRNITTPTLTIFQPAGGNSTRTAILICPGGGFRVLAIDEEGYQVADWFAQHGVTAFVLKYRLAETPQRDDEFAPPNESPEQGIKRILAPLPPDAAPHAIADSIQALKIIRDNAAKYGFAPDRIVAVGFSAGGAVVTGAALAPNPIDRPNYAAPIYGAVVAPTLDIPKDAPPFFLAMASDDPLVQPMVMRLFDALRTADAHPEFHQYRTGQHGFSMKQRGTSDHWIDELWWWMQSFGLTQP